MRWLGAEVVGIEELFMSDALGDLRREAGPLPGASSMVEQRATCACCRPWNQYHA